MGFFWKWHMTSTEFRVSSAHWLKSFKLMHGMIDFSMRDQSSKPSIKWNVMLIYSGKMSCPRICLVFILLCFSLLLLPQKQQRASTICYSWKISVSWKLSGTIWHVYSNIPITFCPHLTSFCVMLCSTCSR